jgi:Mce-associated membrane protein
VLRRLLRALPWILFGVATIVAIVFGVLWWQLRAQEQERREVRAFGQEFATELTNFSADTIEKDADEIKSFAVGQFAKEADVFFGERAIAAIKQAEATSQGDIDSVFVQTVEGDSASVFAVVSETISNVATEGRTDVLRMEIGMVKTESGWKVDRVDVLQSPGSGLIGAEPSK